MTQLHNCFEINLNRKITLTSDRPVTPQPKSLQMSRHFSLNICSGPGKMTLTSRVILQSQQ